tara:strand:+ start:642 stop:977 length:336 start_codon:yes stop_codon:yes gene_type:complete
MIEDLKLISNDTLPENIQYVDSGCAYSTHCLDCKLAICIYDDPSWVKQYVKNTRNSQILKDRINGMPIKEIADKYEVSIRTVHRAFKSNNKIKQDVNIFAETGIIYKKFLP